MRGATRLLDGDEGNNILWAVQVTKLSDLRRSVQDRKLGTNDLRWLDR
jgi:hypothetical protein